MTDVSALQNATIDAQLRQTMRKLKNAKVENADILAPQILVEATGLSHEHLVMHASELLSAAALQRLEEIVARACNFEPLSRIVQQRDFYGATFELNEATLDPRPDSETLIDMVLELADENGWRDRPTKFIDVGTGSGCLAITLLAHLPLAQALATDISEQALEATRRNAINHGVENRLECTNRIALKNIQGPFDFLISNPPYIPSGDIEGLSPQVRNYDPHVALDGGPDGLSIYRAIVTDLSRVVPNGWAVFEVGANQANDVLKVLNATQILRTRTRDDLSGHTRCVAGQTHCARHNRKCFEMSPKRDTLAT